MSMREQLLQELNRLGWDISCGALVSIGSVPRTSTFNRAFDIQQKIQHIDYINSKPVEHDDRIGWER